VSAATWTFGLGSFRTPLYLVASRDEIEDYLVASRD
jgi:hypothetical protein